MFSPWLAIVEGSLTSNTLHYFSDQLGNVEELEIIKNILNRSDAAIEDFQLTEALQPHVDYPRLVFKQNCRL